MIYSYGQSVYYFFFFLEELFIVFRPRFPREQCDGSGEQSIYMGFDPDWLIGFLVFYLLRPVLLLLLPAARSLLLTFPIYYTYKI